MLKINEIFPSIQGEGQFQGMPMLFIRLSGCTRACSFCDTKYHKEIKQILTPTQLVKIIKQSKIKNICFTGGEPLIQLDEIIKVIQTLLSQSTKYNFHLETNGDLIQNKEKLEKLEMYFDYIAVSPKEPKTAVRIAKLAKGYQDVEIKVVSDLKTEGVNMLKYATMIMPLTTYNKKKDLKIMQDVWSYCVIKNKRISLRLHYMVHGKKKMI